MDNSLRKLRKEAGYSSAAKFAEEVGIPAPTYARYEQADDGPETSMPLKNAWAIADKLGCSIDHIVGREHVETDQMRGEVQKFYDGLSDEGRARCDEFFDYVAFLEEQLAERKRREDEFKYIELMQGLERLFLASYEPGGADGGALEFFSKAKMRAAFRDFVERRAADQRSLEKTDVFNSLDTEVRREHGLVGFDEDGAEYVTRAKDPEVESAVIDEADARTRETMAKREEEDEEVIAEIMRAYDKAHPQKRSFRDAGPKTEYFFVTLKDD